MSSWSIAGTLTVEPATARPDLLAEPVAKALAALPDAGLVGVAAIDPELADTAEFCAAYSSPLSASANCVVVAGKRAGETRYAAALVLATTRADVNGVIRRRMDVRKASFAPMAEAVELTGMEYGGITPIGLPAGWPILLDAAVAAEPELIVGSGIRGSKLLVTGSLLAALPGAQVVDALAKPV
ncbi:Cys-tRNA(Pro) deacylase, prolyl-tRNA editing enzyme YbaK/EbsC [Amycolatopsis arida]|uniref:Cys-tRNA(Pro) deacylase, prolyl-tRNA editing enzyme YbaK/EbsC n=1 Tax=Amycolatopsis arida TaxID=587909 RepID=A0A1I5YBE4_9PSEU|nr:YbaK/EbsC family protein [Amycolatopsis arida]TDX90404.1 prolyl-tRNA editing enzyme YbaK/EbsC (Cys-tRNA(Pro) deacylase) [Amycolatopsis arida]SFQ41541.1 Cys-tRNA(Pro) deacylase, prolyl-tRNA editing enzyme YbaK/EbsC [Amycolatopsis arida]